MEASIIVPTWNRSEFLRTCLQSLTDLDFADNSYEIVVVDDGSTDGTHAVVDSFQSDTGPAVRYVWQDRGGVNRARNSGLAAARGHVVFFIDDDELVPVDYLRSAMEVLADRPELDGVGGPALDHPDQRHRTCKRCSLGEVVRQPAADGQVPGLLGGNMGIRAPVFERVGPFEERLSGRGDDSEWFSRQRLTLAYDERLYVWHRKDQPATELVRDQFRQGKALPLRYELQGELYRPSILAIGRGISHSVVRRCFNGVIVAAREFGALTALGRTWRPFGKAKAE